MKLVISQEMLNRTIEMALDEAVRHFLSESFERQNPGHVLMFDNFRVDLPDPPKFNRLSIPGVEVEMVE